MFKILIQEGSFFFMSNVLWVNPNGSKKRNTEKAIV